MTTETAPAVLSNPSNPNPALIKVDEVKNQVTLLVSRPEGSQVLEIYIKAPELANIIDKMVPGNAPKADYADIYKTILLDHFNEDAKKAGRCITRPAIARITKNFIGDPGFSWDHPRAILISNPQKLREGFTLTVKVDAPVPPDTIRKWGKMFMDGCMDITTDARPFTMSWVMNETPSY